MAGKPLTRPRIRLTRAKTLKAQDPVTQPAAGFECAGEFTDRAEATLARLMRKVYEARRRRGMFEEMISLILYTVRGPRPPRSP